MSTFRYLVTSHTATGHIAIQSGTVPAWHHPHAESRWLLPVNTGAATA